MIFTFSALGISLLLLGWAIYSAGRSSKQNEVLKDEAEACADRNKLDADIARLGSGTVVERLRSRWMRVDKADTDK